jgi:hyperosmotically inducible periplasmic protein
MQRIPTIVATLALLLCPYWTGSSYAQSADQQGMNASDRALTAKIRKSVVADKNLSTDAHNVKIISQNGTVTLKGPVQSEDEVTAIMAKATDAAGSPDKVVNQMSVKRQ